MLYRTILIIRFNKYTALEIEIMFNLAMDRKNIY